MIENEASKINPDTSENDLGIRFYYAAYPKSEDWNLMSSHPVAVNYAEKHTLVMIPTLKKADENGDIHDYDFNPAHSQGTSMALQARSNQDEGDDGESFPSENNGQLIPPSDTKVEFF